MKLYESAFTYLPFLYFYVSSVLFGVLYHYPELKLYKPYVVLVFTLVNTISYRFYNITKVAKFYLHRHFWKAATLCFFGVLIANTHELLFHEFEIKEFGYNMLISGFYVLIMHIVTYFNNSYSDNAALYTNIFFLFFPIKRVWQVNLYIYVVFVTALIFLTYSKCTPRSIIEEPLEFRPLLKLFVYLRVHEIYILVGFIQLYLEYRRRYVPDEASVAEIERIISDTNESVAKLSGEKV